MDDGDECFDLDNLEYASDFGAPTDHSSGEVVAMIQGVSSDFEPKMYLEPIRIP